MATGKGRKQRGQNRRRADNPAPSKRFVEAVRKLGLDESGEAFSKALDRLVPKKDKNGSNQNYYRMPSSRANKAKRAIASAPTRTPYQNVTGHHHTHFVTWYVNSNIALFLPAGGRGPRPGTVL